jgi:hypothetical protein
MKLLKTPENGNKNRPSIPYSQSHFFNYCSKTHATDKKLFKSLASSKNCFVRLMLFAKICEENY